MKVSDIFLWIIIIVFILGMIGITIVIISELPDFSNFVKTESVKSKPSSSRMILVEKTKDYKIYYDKYTNVIYLFNKDTFYPILNPDGSIHLYGNDRAVG